MEWLVKNAINRDVERQHLNKILKEIKSTVDSIIILLLHENKLRLLLRIQFREVHLLLLLQLVLKFTLDGNVTGTGSVVNGNDVTITTTVDPSILGIPEVPIDSNVYWRGQGQWQGSRVFYNPTRTTRE